MNTKEKTAVEFQLGQIVATPGALDALTRNNTNGLEYLQRHASGDWGDLDEEDKQANDNAVKSGERIYSVYFLADETKLLIITDAAINEGGTRTATTFLLPEDY